jgi:serine protease
VPTDAAPTITWRRAALVALLVPLVAAAARAQVCGDADGDGLVSDVDAVRTLRAAVGLSSSCTLDRCDVDADGVLSEADGTLVLRKAAALPIVERCGRGGIAGTVRIAETGLLGGAEAEPNDGAGLAQGVGLLAVGASYRLTGTIEGANDAFDGFAFVATEPAALALDLHFDAAPGVDLDLLIDDPASGTAFTCESAAEGHETCTAEVGVGDAPRRIDVAVLPAAGSHGAVYTLTVDAHRATAPGPGLTAGAGAAPPVDVAVAAYREREADFVPGELIAQLETPARAAGSGDAGASAVSFAAAVTDAVQAAGMDDGWEPIAATPGGAVLFAVPATEVAGRQTAGTGADDRAAAKRARAELRARTRESRARLAAAPGVAYAQPNYLVRPALAPSDPLLGRQWHYALLGLEHAWDLTSGSADVVVAVVDTGIRSDHPDLQGQLVRGFDFITDPQRANDGDALDPDPFDPGDQPGAALGGTYHGTHVAGTIAAATDNRLGVAGVGWHTRLMPVRALGVGGGTSFDIAEAIMFAAGLPNASGTLPDAPAQIINLSIAAPGDNPFMRAAVDAATEAGALVVAAAGNTASDAVVSPATFANTLTVAATDLLARPAVYSSFGAAVDLAAPGGSTRVDLNGDGSTDGVVSTLLPGELDYTGYQGTSMAAAHVSGIAALMLARAGPASPAAVRAALTTSAQDRGTPGRDAHYGFGLVDPAAAIRALAHLSPPSAPLLALDTTALGFDRTRTTLPVHAANAGGGVLVVGDVTATTTDGIAWLSARYDASAGDVVVDVDRTSLIAGDYTGQVDVRSNGGEATLAVSMQVAPSPVVDVGPVSVVLVDPETRARIAELRTSFARGYAYRFDGIHGGAYEIFAGTDRDHDGMICDLGELCGAFPVLAAPQAVTVVGGQTSEGRDFVLSLVTNADTQIEP